MVLTFPDQARTDSVMRAGLGSNWGALVPAGPSSKGLQQGRKTRLGSELALCGEPCPQRALDSK